MFAIKVFFQVILLGGFTFDSKGITFFTSCDKAKITMNPSSDIVRSYNFTSSMSKKIITFPKFICNYPQCCSK